jgi:hypothetical protein
VPTFAVGSGALPAGLALGSDGVLAGTPNRAGQYTFGVVASSSAGTATAGPFTIEVRSAPVAEVAPIVTSGDPPAGAVGTIYRFALTASGSPAPTFGLGSGALPPGLSIGASGSLTGTPTTAGSYTFSVTVTNHAGVVTGGPYSVAVAPSGTPAPVPAPTVDAFVWADGARAASRLVSPKLRTAASGELLLAFVTADGPAAPTQKITKVTGGGLTWTLVNRANQTYGTAEVWQAYAKSVFSDTVTARLARNGYRGSITVTAYGSAAKVVVSSAAATGRTNRPQVTITVTAANSLIWAAGHDWDRSETRVSDAGQTVVHQFVDKSAHDTHWVQRLTQPTTTPGNITIGTSSPAKDRWQFVAVEVLPERP